MLKIGFCFGADRLFTFPQTQARDREAQIWLQTGPCPPLTPFMTLGLLITYWRAKAANAP